MNFESLFPQSEALLPLAVAWATEQEQKILRDGVWVSGEEIADAHAIGVQEPKISFDTLLGILPRLASMAPLKRFTFDHLLCPAIQFGAK